VEVRTLDCDGTKLVCLDNGRQDDRPAVVLVHGWCCDHSFFEPQAKHFDEAGRRVIALDLRGHGGSDAPDVQYTMELFADDVAWCIRQLGLVQPIVIGHSMGGIIAFDLAARYPDLPAAIVMVDSSVARSASGRTAIDGICKALSGPDRIKVMRDYVGSALFIPTDDPVRKEALLARMSAAPAHVVVSAMEGLRDYDPAYAKGMVTAPSLFIAADEPVPRADMTVMRELLPRLHHGRTVGSGHFCQLEVPDQVNAMIDRFIAVERL